MVLGLLVISAIPTVTGVAQGISSKKQQNAAMKEKIKFNMTATLAVDGGPPTEAWIVLAGGKVSCVRKPCFFFCLVPQTRETGQSLTMINPITQKKMYIDHPDASRPGHKFNGYYFKYPSEQGYQGLVSTIQDDPPMLNWLYVDAATGAVRYGSRKDTVGHIYGPWGWSSDEKFLTMDEDDWRFMAVEEEDDEGMLVWAVYLSRDRDGSLKPKAERQEQEQEQQQEEGEGVDVRYTHKWAPIKLLRKLQLGVESGWVKGPRGEASQSGNNNNS